MGDQTTAAAAARLAGKIKNLRPTYGFIAGDDTVDRFFLPTALDKKQGVKWEELKPGDAVEFTPIEHEKGQRATAVRLTSRV